MGRDASDIDLWVPIRYYPEKARRLQLVQQLGDALGQYGFRQAGQGRTIDEMMEDLMRPPALNWDAAPAQPYAGVNLTGIEEAYELIPGGVNLGGYNPLQVIFCDKPLTTGIHSSFHVNLSKFYTNDEGEAVASISALRDSANRTLTIQDTRGLHPEVFLRYLQKMKRKFPDFNVNIAIPVTDESFNPLYQALFNGGVLNGSRQVLSTQGQGVAGDSLGLTNGTGVAPTAGSAWGRSVIEQLTGLQRQVLSDRDFEQARRTAAAMAARADQRYVDMYFDELATVGVPPTATFVYDEARVQPGLSGGITGTETFRVAPEPTPFIRRG